MSRLGSNRGSLEAREAGNATESLRTWRLHWLRQQSLYCRVAFVTSPSKFLLLPTAQRDSDSERAASIHISVGKKLTMEKVLKQTKRYGSLPFTLMLGHFSNTTLSLQPYHFDYAQYRPRFPLKKIATSTYLHTNWCLETLPPFRYL